MHIIFKIWIFCSLLVILLWHFHGSISSARTKKSDPIKIAINNWTSQRILSHIAGRLFEKQGYKVEYIKQDTYEQWGALYRGEIHVQPEVWEGTNAKLFSRMVKEGGVMDAGTQIEKGYGQSLSLGVWYLDIKQIHTLLGGIKKLPDIQYLEIRDTRDNTLAFLGEAEKQGVLIKEYPNFLKNQMFRLTVKNQRGFTISISTPSHFSARRAG